MHHTLVAAPAISAWSLDDLRLSSAEVGLDDVETVADIDALSIAAAQTTRARSVIDNAMLRASIEERELSLAAERAEGFAAGRIEGAAIESARLRSAMLAAEQALASLNATISPNDAIEENISALAIGVARQLIGRELAADPSLVANLVKLALREVPVDQPVRVRINPSDLRHLSQVSDIEHQATWIADETVSRGGCLVESRDRLVDGRVETALERLFRRLASLDE